MNISNKKILVTGGAGFIGSHLVDKLIEKKYTIIIIDNLSKGKEKNLNPKAKFYKIDIQDKKVSEIFEKEKPEIVFHYAAQINASDFNSNLKKDVEINVLGTLNILESCRRNKVKKIIFASSSAVYGEAGILPTPENYLGQPIYPYGINKLVGERYLNFYKAKYNIPFICFRFSNVYGPRQNYKEGGGVIAVFLNKFISGKQPIIYGDGNQTRDFIFVEDVIKTNILVLEKEKEGIFNIGTTKNININNLFRKIRKITKSNLKEKHNLKIINYPKNSCLDCSKAKNEIGWEFSIDLEEGLKKTAKWFKEEFF
jgi:UDP-glucose 4-epimerase